MTALDSSELLSRWNALGRGEEPLPSAPTEAVKQHLYYRPLEDAAHEFVRWAQSPHERIYTGFTDLDREMRGIAAGEMCLVIGYSHSGKTLTLLQMLIANRDKNVIYFVPDEPRTLVLIKLACVMHGVNAIDLERQVAADNGEAIDLLRNTAVEHFPNLAVFDQSMALSDMEKAMGEMTEIWGQKPDLVVFDYLELLQGGGEDVPSKANTLKAWGRRHDVPLLVLHQTSRTSGADGKRLTISSGSFGGEQQATHIIGVRRKRFEIEAQIRELEAKLDKSSASERAMEQLDFLRYEARVHAHTLTINLVKNKRPAGTLIDDIDFEIEEGTGRLSRITDGELPRQFLNEVRGGN
jgi:KaiC/GvpD/RAD55 family RecA-like ATPase